MLISFQHKLGGYPEFVKQDPREEGYLENHKILLFQLISECYEGNAEICWGDGGLANFFITEKDLINKNFEKVLYHWDSCQ